MTVIDIDAPGTPQDLLARYDLEVPVLGRDYEIKVNFFKVETSASAIDSIVDSLNQQAIEEGREPGSEKWNVLREQLKKAESEADFEVFDESGESIGKASDLGTTTFLRTVKFSASSATYKVRVRCTSGAGLYHLTFEYD